jgi:hypothetical protein
MHAVLYCNKQWWCQSTKEDPKIPLSPPVASYQRRVKIKQGKEREGLKEGITVETQ